MAGYQTDGPCVICGETPATVEPRFGYTVCEAHENLPPVEVSRIMTERQHGKGSEAPRTGS